MVVSMLSDDKFPVYLPKVLLQVDKIVFEIPQYHAVSALGRVKCVVFEFGCS